MKKSQSAIEFIILFSFLLLVIVIVAFAINSTVSSQQKKNNYKALQNVGEFLKNELDMASVTESNYYRSFTLPDTINQLDYEIKVYPGKNISAEYSIIKVWFPNLEFTTFTYENITGQVKKGKNNISKNNQMLIINQK